MRALFLLCVALSASLVSPQQLVADVNPFTDDPGSMPGPFVSFGAGVAFAATTASTGRELWFLPDGSGQAVPIADLAAGSADADPEHVVGTGSALFFAASDGSTRGLYVSDGSASGTRRLSRVDLSPPATGPQIFAAGSRAFAFADDGVSGPELWVSDGTAAGTRLVRELEPGPGGCRLLGATVVGTELWFAVRTPHLAETRTLLVRSDGTASGTVVVTSTDQGGPLVARELLVAGSFVLFGGSLPGGQADYELWRTDGTATGTRAVLDLDPNGSGYVGPMVALAGGRVAFVGQTSAYGFEPVVSDGTPNGTVIVDVNVLVGRGSTPTHLTAAGNDLFLFAIGPPGSGLYRIDGNQLTVTFVRSLLWQSAARPPIVASGSRLFFRALDASAQGRTAAQLWLSDGTAPGTVVLRDLRQGLHDPGFDHLLAHGNGVTFTADDGIFGAEPWRSDGTPAGTGPAANVHASPTAHGAGSQPTFFLHAATVSVFDADDGDRGREPWVTDGRSAQRLADLVPGADGSTLVPIGDTPAGVVFASTPAAAGAPETAYWVREAASGVLRRLGFAHALGPPLPGTVAPDGDRGVFLAAAALASGTVQGYELLHTDGASLQTVTPRSPLPVRAVTVVAGVPFFAAPGSGGGYEPFTLGGQIVDLRPGAAGSNPGAGLGLALRRAWVFDADDGSSGVELWRTDGTPSGTRRLADLAPGSSSPRRGLVVGSIAFFVADVAGAGSELCATDGSAAGTSLLADVRPGPVGSDPDDLVAQAGGVWFTADDGVHGRELWFSDGTAGGTRRVAPGAPAAPAALTPLGSRRVLFVGADGAEGDEPWVTDGTAAGTRRLAAINPGPGGSGVTSFAVRPDGTVLFAADDGRTGREPWSFDPGAVAVRIGASCGVGTARLAAGDPVLGTVVAVSGGHEVVANLAGVLLLSTPARTQLGGCLVYVDPAQVAVPLALVNSTFQLALAIPNAPRLLGAVLHLQAGFGPFVAPPGFALSNGVALRLGR